MIRKTLAAAVILAAAASTIGASAHQTTGDASGASGAPADAKCGANVTQVGDVYIDNRYVTTGGAFSVWVYLESNGHGGLQTENGTQSDVLGADDIENCTTGGHNTPGNRFGSDALIL